MTDMQWTSYKNNVIRYLRGLINTCDEDYIRNELRDYVCEMEHDAESARQASKQQEETERNDESSGMTDFQFAVMVSLMAYDLGHAPKAEAMANMIGEVEKFIGILG